MLNGFVNKKGEMVYPTMGFPSRVDRDAMPQNAIIKAIICNRNYSEMSASNLLKSL